MSQPLDRPEFHFDCYAAIHHPSAPRVLLERGCDGWLLPHLQPTEDHFGVVGHLNAGLLATRGIGTTVRHCMFHKLDRQANRMHAVYAMENHSPGWEPTGAARWMGRTEMTDVTLAVPEHRAVLLAWLEELEGGAIPRNRSPWSYAGWFDTAMAWIGSRLEEAGAALAGPVRQLRAWQRCCLLQVPSTAGLFYFKAAPAVFAHEAGLTGYLADQFPDLCPRGAAVDPERNWMLLQDTSGVPLYDVGDERSWAEALMAYAELQVRTVRLTGTLHSLGCPHRGVEALATGAERLFHDLPALLPGQPEGLTLAQIERLRQSAPTVGELCRRLSCLGIPD